MKIETQCLHEGYYPKNGEPRVVPIVQSTTYRFDSTDHIAQLFDMPTEFMYSRFANPTCDAVEKKIAALEGGVGAMLTSSGQAASLCSILNLCNAGDSFVAVSAIYGGTVNLFSVTLKKFGIECIWVSPDATEAQIKKAIKKNTKVVFGETIANPALRVFDIERFAKVAHQAGIPLIVDNTFATPALCRPIQWGADIVIHSTTKYMDGHALQVGGVIVDSGNFDWAASKKFPEFTEPDESYHGVVYTRDFGKMAYIIKARMQLMRDLGCYQSAHAAFLLNLGLETLPVRMKRYCLNASVVAEYFKCSDKIESVTYPGLPESNDRDLVQKYLPDGCSGVISISIKGGRSAAVRFMDALKLASNEVHVADIRTCVLHPASATHRQLTDEQLVAAGIDGGMIRFSCGLENVEDIIADIEQALAAV
ncbi:MAG: O-acetylhomoserine aminocarboxypropyltransferase/cysteine synthase [Spirochaetaceae bacterium]|nr:O-acetylhomoserine aminocarboxypropyltransferase/cysteine synthase [Spirochaetaceae bacterium]